MSSNLTLGMAVCGVDELGSTWRIEVLEGTLPGCVGVEDDGGTLTLEATVLFGTTFESSAGSSLAIGSESLIRLLG
jgi:hypothetical protein